MENNYSYNRYQRQVLLKEFGEQGQQKLTDAKVLVIGAGGLGCPALLYLAAAGIGCIGVADHDIVQLSNLHRQVLYSVEDIGLAKATRAAEILSGLNPSIEIVSYPEMLTVNNAFTIIQNFDIVIDGTDNFASRYMINDACMLLDKPLVYGAVSTYEGQVAVFNTCANEGKSANYRDLFPDPPQQHLVPNCEEAGVLGVLPGIIGTMQASETIKLLTGIGEPLINQVLTYSILTNEIYKLKISPSVDTSLLIPKNQAAFENTDYEWLCGAATAARFEIGHDLFDQLLSAGNIDVIDVREKGERPVIDMFACRQIPLSAMETQLSLLTEDTIVTICQSGTRSQLAAKKISEAFGTAKKVYSLQGGILGWKQHHQKELP
jgi:adenylyltransferase/sulfurtransferase